MMDKAIRYLKNVIEYEDLSYGGVKSINDAIKIIDAAKQQSTTFDVEGLIDRFWNTFKDESLVPLSHLIDKIESFLRTELNTTAKPQKGLSEGEIKQCILNTLAMLELPIHRIEKLAEAIHKANKEG